MTLLSPNLSTVVEGNIEYYIFDIQARGRGREKCFEYRSDFAMVKSGNHGYIVASRLVQA